MKVFLSYAAEDRELAEQIQLALVGAGHSVFFDRESLPAGGDYHARIRAGVAQSDLMIFLISPDSVARHSYALTELKQARARWTHPKDRILPVMLRSTDWNRIPNYLKSVTVLEPEGNVAVEVLSALGPLAAALRATDGAIEISSTHERGNGSKVRAKTIVALIGVLAVALVLLIGTWVLEIYKPGEVETPLGLGQETAPKASVVLDRVADEEGEAALAAREILASLQAREFEKLWNSQTSDWYKATLTRDSFLANLTIGRQQLGAPLGSPKLIDSAYSKSDPLSGFQGEIYAFNYLSSYTAGSFYERIVVVKEADGKFRLSGLFGAPAPK